MSGNVLCPCQLHETFPGASVGKNSGATFLERPGDKVLLKVESLRRNPQRINPVVSASAGF
jgi:hypothetical protein